MKISPTLKERFDRFTQRQPNGCLLWLRPVSGNPYGMMSIASGVSRGPHHVSWFLATGRWPERLRHMCDTPMCCEFEHLLEGSQQENMADKVARGRQAKGEGHGMTKVSDADVVEMRKLRAAGWKLSELSERFNTCQSNVSIICRGETRAPT